MRVLLTASCPWKRLPRVWPASDPPFLLPSLTLQSSFEAFKALSVQLPSQMTHPPAGRCSWVV